MSCICIYTPNVITWLLIKTCDIYSKIQNSRRESSPPKTLHDRAAVAQLAHKLANELLHGVLSLLLAAAAVLLLLATMLLLLATVMLLLATTAVVRLLLLSGVAATTASALVRRRNSLAAGEVDVHPAGVLFGVVLEAELAADLLYAGLDLLDVVCAVVALSDDAVFRVRSYGSVFDPEPGSRPSRQRKKHTQREGGREGV